MPQWEKSYSAVDHKDKSYSPSILKDLKGLDNMTAILQGLSKIGTAEQTSGVVFMGDYTSWGKVEQIDAAIEIFDTLLTKPDNSKVPIFGVPGNHDVDKEEALLHGSKGKFKTLESAFQKFGWHPLPIDSSKRVELSSGSVKIPFALINTSIGSWSPHLFPDLLQKEFSEDKLNDKPIGKTLAPEGIDSPDGDFSKMGLEENRAEQLFAMDIPFISKGTTASLRKEFSRFSDHETHVIIGHHNLLPQRTPRITPYGEMLNAGMFRRYLQNTQKNIIYLHGHIQKHFTKCIEV